MKRQAALLALVILIGLVSGCASPQPQSAQLAERSMAPMPAAEAPAADFAEEGAAASGVNFDVEGRKIVYRANMSMVVLDVEQTMQHVKGVVAASGGYVAGSQLGQYRNDLMRGSMTVRVPVEAYEDVLAQFRALAVRVLSENSNTEDVTAEYTDLEARLRNLEAAEQELLALLQEVRERPNATAEDILDVFNALTEKRGEIEQVKGRMQYLDNLTALSTIDLDLVPDEITQPVLEEGWQPLVTLKSAFRSLVNILQGLVDLLINLVVVVLPVLIIVLLPVLALIFLVRWLLGRRRRASGPASE